MGNQSTAQGFEPCRPTHAIEQVALSVLFDREVPPAQFESADRWPELKERLGEILPAFIQQPGLVFSGNPSRPVPRQGIAGYQFARFSPDGRSARTLQINNRMLVFASIDYTHWSDFRVEALYAIETAAQSLFFKSDASATEAVITYSNRFLWKGDPAQMRGSHLFAPISRWINPGGYQAERNWHCNCGEFRAPTQTVRRLVNVTTSAVSDVGAPDIRAITVEVSLSDALNQLGFEPTNPMPDVDSLRWITERADDLHSSEKLVMAEIICAEMQERIALNAGD